MSLQGHFIRLGIGVLVWIGTFFPFRRMVSEVFTEASREFQIRHAVGLSSTMGAVALIAWGAEPWYSYSVLAACLGFVALYLVLVSIERFRSSSEIAILSPARCSKGC